MTHVGVALETYTGSSESLTGWDFGETKLTSQKIDRPFSDY